MRISPGSSTQIMTRFGMNHRQNCPFVSLVPHLLPFVIIVAAVGCLDLVCWSPNKLNKNWLLKWGRLPLALSNEHDIGQPLIFSQKH